MGLFDNTLGAIIGELRMTLFGPPALVMFMGIVIVIIVVSMSPGTGSDTLRLIALVVGIILAVAASLGLCCFSLPAYCVAVKAADMTIEELKAHVKETMASHVKKAMETCT